MYSMQFFQKVYLVMEELSFVRRRKLASKHEQGACWGDGDLMRGARARRVGGGNTTPLVLFNVVTIEVVVERTGEEMWGAKLVVRFSYSRRHPHCLVLSLPFGSVVKLSTEKDELVLVEGVGGQRSIGAST